MEEPRRRLIIDGPRQAGMKKPRRRLIIDGLRQADYEILLSAFKKILDELDNLPSTNYRKTSQN